MNNVDPIPNTDPERPATSGEVDVAWLQNELNEAQKTVRTLKRQLSKEQQRDVETDRAHHLTVTNLAEAKREHSSLLRDRDLWKTRAEAEDVLTSFQVGGLTLELTPAEVKAIRKAMARLHHPDTGGDVERMKAWNAALDPLES